MFQKEDIGIAIHIGNTTISAVSCFLHTGKRIGLYQKQNTLTEGKKDAVQLLSSASDAKSCEKMRCALKKQLSSIICSLFREADFLSKDSVGKNISLKRVVFVGSTLMQSLATNAKIAPLAAYPFVPQDLFGHEIKAADFCAQTEAESLLKECNIYSPPALSAFIGGDFVSKMVGLDFSLEAKSPIFFADIGDAYTLACFNPLLGRITALSPMQNPYAIGIAKSLSLLGLVSTLRKTGAINAHGTLPYGVKKLNIGKNTYVSQKDIRRFQYAKATICSTLLLLWQKLGTSDCGTLFLAPQGFSILEEEALENNVIPPCFKGKIRIVQDSLIKGAILMLVSDSHRKKAENISLKTEVIDAEKTQGYQKLFIDSLSFCAD